MQNKGSVLALKNYIGANVRLPLTVQFNINAKAGVGYNFYFGPENYEDYKFEIINGIYSTVYHKDVPWDAMNYDFSYIFSLGLEYKLSKK